MHQYTMNSYGDKSHDCMLRPVAVHERNILELCRVSCWIAPIHPRCLQEFGLNDLREYGLSPRRQTPAGHTYGLRCVNRLCGGHVVISRINPQVRALLIGANDPLAICITAQTRYVSIADVGRTSSRRVLAVSLVSFDVLLHFIATLRAAFVLVGASVASLRVLRQLRSLYHLRFRYTFVELLAADATVHMAELCDGHSVWGLHIGIAMQRCVHGMRRAIQTFAIQWSVQRAYPVRSARCCHSHGLQQALA